METEKVGEKIVLSRPKIVPSPSSGNSRGKCRKRPAPVLTGSLAQTRLDRIANPTDGFLRSYVKWLNRFQGNRETYPSELLCERLETISSEIATLMQETQNPSRSLPPEEWTTAHDRLLWLQGQSRAIQEVLTKREKAIRDGDTSRRGCKPPILTVVPEPASSDLEQDPFAED